MAYEERPGAFATILIPADQASELKVVKLEVMTALSKVPHSARGRVMSLTAPNRLRVAWEMSGNSSGSLDPWRRRGLLEFVRSLFRTGSVGTPRQNLWERR